jgi:hypothetical protein
VPSEKSAGIKAFYVALLVIASRELARQAGTAISGGGKIPWIDRKARQYRAFQDAVARTRSKARSIAIASPDISGRR